MEGPSGSATGPAISHTSNTTAAAAAAAPTDIQSASRHLRDAAMLRRSTLELEDITGTGNNPKVEITPAQRMLAACSGSLLTSLLVTPLDVVRVRLQSQTLHTAPDTASPSPPSSSPLRAIKNPFAFRSSALSVPELGVTTCCREVFWVNNATEACLASPFTTSLNDSCVVEQVSKRRFEGTWEGLVKIARHEGLSSLWRGLSPTLLMAIPANVIYFTGYDWLRSSQASPFSSFSGASAALIAGSSARAIAATAISPLEMFKTRLQASSSQGFRETLLGLRDMMANEGVLSLWRGLSLTLWRDVPFSGIYWLGYETVKDYLRARREASWSVLHDHPSGIHLPSAYNRQREDLHAENTFLDAFVAGATSGAVAAFLTTPFDVGKTQRQISHVQSDEIGARAMSMPRVLYEIWKSGGAGALWRGTTPRMLKVAPACAIMISSYEVGKKMAMKMNHQQNGGEKV